MRSLVERGMALLGALAVLTLRAEESAKPRVARGPVVFVCEHGNVKSLIAREWFDRLAAERGFAVRALSRGLAPEPSVPAPIVERLREDGFDVRAFHPRALAPADLAGASRLVMIGAEPPAWASQAGVPVDSWNGIPPASESYDRSRDALRERIGSLLESLADRGQSQ